jgi:hypothetical protein
MILRKLPLHSLERGISWTEEETFTALGFCLVSLPLNLRPIDFTGVLCHGHMGDEGAVAYKNNSRNLTRLYLLITAFINTPALIVNPFTLR